MDIIEAIKGRQSIRAFTKKIVPKEMVTNILDTARFAPSGVNTQPWKVAVVFEKMRTQLGEKITEALDNNISSNPDYMYYPEEWFEPYKSRRKACGSALYSALDIDYHETEKRKAAWYRNYYFFEAPIGLLFFVDKKLQTGSIMDMGMFIQNVMLAARHYGLETCPQAALAEYPDIVRAALGMDDSHLLLCGMALGYADYENPINQYRTSREEVSTFTQFYI